MASLALSFADDGSWETLFTIGENLHAGWNYHKWDTPEDYLKYRDVGGDRNTSR